MTEELERASPRDEPQSELERTYVIRVFCGDCKHTWIVAYLPMDAMKVAKLTKGLMCPKCANSSKRIYMGSGREPDTRGEAK